ncbi:MAG: hypothetical protein Q4D04_14515, partial [Clostridia bacterium]|nr:hypothetical protein [Clostridia bacterium]
LYMRNVELEAIRRENARQHIEAYKARLNEKSLWRDLKGLIVIASALGAMLAIGLASVIAAC